MDLRGEGPSLEIEGLVALAHTDEGERAPRVRLHFYRENPEGERTIQELTLTLAQAERLGQFFRWFARREVRRSRRQLRQPDRGRRDESRGRPGESS